MAEDKKLFYHILKNLHFQTEYLHFIYRNTNKATMQQRKANFWRIAQIPTIFVAIFNIYIIFLSRDWIVGCLTISVSIIVAVFIGFYIYDRKVKKKNQIEEDYMDLNATLIFIRNSRDQVEIIDSFGIKNMEVVKKAKVDEIEDLIKYDLNKTFTKFVKISKKKVEDFLRDSSLDLSKFKGRLERIETFMVEKSDGYKSRKSYKKLKAMIQYLQDLDDNNNSQIEDLKKVFLEEGD
jgi:hypothetical protein